MKLYLIFDETEELNFCGVRNPKRTAFIEVDTRTHKGKNTLWGSRDGRKMN